MKSGRKALRRHSQSQNPFFSSRLRLHLETLEDRAVPAGLDLVIGPPDSIPENGGATTTAVVTRVDADTTNSLTVRLTSSDITEATVPASVVIPAGQASATFTIRSVDDTVLDGPQNVTVTANAVLNNTPLTKDNIFGGNGIARQSFITQAVALAPDGKVVVAGTFFTGVEADYYDFAIARYNANGTPDTTFNGGVVILNVTDRSDQAQAVVVQPDGKIVAGGYGTIPNGNGGTIQVPALVRYNANGTLDTTFGNAGKVVDTLPGTIYDMAMLPEGKILAGGNLSLLTTGGFGAARYNANGTLDTTFGSGGKAVTPVGQGGFAFGLAVGPDGRIVVAGHEFPGNESSRVAAIRFEANGRLDPDFAGGVVLTNLTQGRYEGGRDVVVQPDGKVVVVGQVGRVGTFPPVYDPFIVRYNFNGTLDTSFFNSGVVVSDFGGTDYGEVRVALQADGHIVVASNVNITPSTGVTKRAGLARYNFLGTLTDRNSGQSSAPTVEGLVMSPTGSFYMASSQNFNGILEKYTGFAGLVASDTLTVLDNETPPPPNNPPVAVNDAYTVNEDVTLIVGFQGAVSPPGVLANDSDPDNNPLTAIRRSNPANGTLVFNSNGSFTYRPNANFFGTDSFTYVASDGNLESNLATVTITVNPVNDPPVAVNDEYTTSEDTPLVVAAAGVLLNDSDADGDALTAVLETNPAGGTVALNADGSFTYTPRANFSGLDRFSYRASDGTNTSNLATVALTVTAVNDAPVARNDTYTTNEDTALTVSAPGLLGNDSDVENSPLTAIRVTGPANGTLVLNANGSLTYTPNANFNGTDSFTYKVNDGAADSNTATVAITVNPGADAPAARNDQYATDEDTALTVAASGVLGNDADGDGDALTAALVTGPANGSLILNADGSFTYTPNANFNGTDSFTYKASDGTLESNVATATIVVTPVNDAPVARDDEYRTDEDVPLVLAAPGVLGNDSDVDNSTLTVTVVARPVNGSLTLNTNGAFTYTPNLNFGGIDTFRYQVGDGSVLSNVATVTITILPVNDPPLALGDTYTTDEEVPLTVAAPGVLANDSDPEGDPLTVSLVGNPFGGTVTLNADGSFVYTPSLNYFGSDAFTYKVNDGMEDSNVTTVFITIKGTPDAPVARDDAYTVSEDSTLLVNAPSIFQNDSDPDGDRLTAILVTNLANGTVTINEDQSLFYQPNPNFHGTDSFTYKATDGTLESNVVTVTFTVTPRNDAPVARDDAYSTNENTALVVAAPGVLGNDSDVDGDALTVALVSGPTNGTLALNGNGSFTYTPNANFSGSDAFTYRASDGSLDSNVATVRLTVTAVNEAPAARDDEYTTSEDTPLVAAAPGVLANDSDADGDPLAVSLVAGPTSGTLALNGNGSFTYTPNANFSGSDSFTYKVNDGTVDSNVATVRLTVTPVNDAPVARDDSYTTDEDTQLVVAAPGVLGNDSDVDGDALTVALVSGPAHGTLTLGGNGSFTYTPGANFNGSDSFQYRVSDGSLDSNVATVRLTVTPVQDPPTANAGSDQTASEGSAVNFDGSGSADVDGDALTYSWDFGDGSTGTGVRPRHTYADDGVFTATLTVSDGRGGSATDTLTVTVENVAPTVRISGPTPVLRGQSRTYTFTATDPSPVDQAGTFGYAISWGDGSGETASGTSVKTVAHTFASSGTYTITVRATDKDGSQGPAATFVVQVVGAQLQGNDLVVIGTDQDDTIIVTPADTTGNLTVTFNGTNLGTFKPTGQLLVYGLGGNDTIQLKSIKTRGVTTYVTVPSILFGGNGNDTLDGNGGNGNNILLGGDGNDELKAGEGREILFGGLGSDLLRSGKGEDILFGGVTDFDDDLTALAALRAEWGRTDADLNLRVDHLLGTRLDGRRNGSYFLNATTAHDDNAVDELFGFSGMDWYLYRAGSDVLRTPKNNERKTLI